MTTSKDPVLRGEWLQPGALVCAVGANDPNARELDNAVLERATFVCCDSREQARLESGDLIEPVAQGVLDWLEVHELQDVVAGELAGARATRTSSSSSRTGSPRGTSPSGRRRRARARAGAARELCRLEVIVVRTDSSVSFPSARTRSGSRAAAGAAAVSCG